MRGPVLVPRPRRGCGAPRSPVTSSDIRYVRPRGAEVVRRRRSATGELPGAVTGSLGSPGLTQCVFFIRRLEGRLGELRTGSLACPGPVSITSGSMSSGQHRTKTLTQKCPSPRKACPSRLAGAGHATEGSDPGKEPEAMADPVLQLSDQAETTSPASGGPAVRRPWHPSQGGAPWDVEKSGSEGPFPARPSVSLDPDRERIYPRDCHCPACRRAARQ